MARDPRRRRAALRAAIAGPVLAGAVAAHAQSGPVNWARFDEPSALAAARAIAGSDAPGGAAIPSLTVNDGWLDVQGRFGEDDASRWSTLGVEIAPMGARTGADLGNARVLRVRLAAADARALRLRIKAGNREIAGAGCYPVVMQRVTPVPTDYAIPLAAFRSPGWCGAKAVSIAETLRAVERVEVTANDGPAGPVRFSVGRIDFLADDSSPPADEFRGEPDPPAASALRPSPDAAAPAASVSRAAPAPVPAPAAAPRRKAPATPATTAPAPASAQRVVCEHSARYDLVLCH